MAVARRDVMVEATLSLVDAEQAPGPELIGAGGDRVVHPGGPLGEAGRGRGAELYAVAIHALERCGPAVTNLTYLIVKPVRSHLI